MLWLLLLACSLDHPTVADEGTDPGSCSNGLDDDDDGFVDCLDFDCDEHCDFEDSAR